MKKGIYLLLVVMLSLAGCKSTKRLTVPEGQVSRYLSSKLQLTVPGRNGAMSVGGSMKLKSRERMQLSFLMPLFRVEVARIEATPDEVLLVDRMNKRFVRATREELRSRFSKEVEFARLEKILFDASLPGGKSELTGRELGLPSLDKAKIRLYDFSDREFAMNPTELGARYEEVPVDDLIQMLKALLR